MKNCFILSHKDSLVSDEETPKDTKKEKVGFLDKLKKMFIDD